MIHLYENGPEKMKNGLRTTRSITKIYKRIDCVKILLSRRTIHTFNN